LRFLLPGDGAGTDPARSRKGLCQLCEQEIWGGAQSDRRSDVWSQCTLYVHGGSRTGDFVSEAVTPRRCTVILSVPHEERNTTGHSAAGRLGRGGLLHSFGSFVCPQGC